MVDTWVGRSLGASVIVGNFLYDTGGRRFNQAESTVERASIDGAGALGTPSIQGATLATPTITACSVVIGNHVYLIGGANTSDLDAIQSAEIDADGAIGGFTLSSDHLTTAREEAACAVVGNYVYVLGGFNATQSPRYLDSIERAQVQADGTLGPFSVVAGVHLVTPRGGHRAVVLQDQIYVLGGFGAVGGNEVLQRSAETAFIASDSSLGAFQLMSSGNLTGTGRTDFKIAQLGQWLYAIGGTDGNGPLTTIDYLVLTQQGTIGGDLSPAPVQLAVARRGPTLSVLGNQLFVIAGVTVSSGNFIYQTSIEHAALAADGTVGSFPGTPDGGTLSTARFGHASGITGDHVWHLGGTAQGAAPNTIDESALP